MRISEKYINRYEETLEENSKLFDYDQLVNVQQTTEAEEYVSFAQKHPAAAVTAAVALVGVPLVGVGVGGAMAEASSLPENQDVHATVSQAADLQTETLEITQEITKDVAFTVNGPGHLEAVDNCVIEGNNISFDDATETASFRIVSDVEGGVITVSAGDTSLGSTDYVVLDAYADYGTISVNVEDVLAEQRAAEEQARIEAEQKAAAEAEAKAKAQQEAAQKASTAKKTTTTTKANTTQSNTQNNTTQSATTTQSTSTQSASSSSAATPYSGAAQQSMTNEEMTEARAIFDAYNNWRASKGLNRVAWSDDCCNMAFGSVSGCAAIKNLTHRLGIPSAVQMNYSDILLYSTWQMDANEAVTRWSQSTGHRKMMQCDSATVAGVACYNDSGTWYYAIVYNFAGCNQSGN